MLGWEFPPIINGGLGVACHDLSFALSDFADISMIIPKSSPGFIMSKVNLIGMNTVNPEMLAQLTSPVDMPFSTHAIPADLDPYHSSQSDSINKKSEQRAGAVQAQKNNFDITDLYGGDVIKKVFDFARHASAYAAQLDFDIIHAHDWMTIPAAMWIKAQSGKPLVLHIHSLEVDRGGEASKGWVYELEKKGMECADVLMPVSHFTANNIVQYYGIDKNKIAVVHNGSKPVDAYKSEKRFREKTVLFVGRLTRQKGPEKFLEIAARVLEKDKNVRFVMAGTGDHFRKLLEDSSYKQLGNRFHLTGFLDPAAMHALLSESDVYCMPSVSEPFGLSAVEAAQFGIPCVISKQSGVAEVLNGSLKFDFWDIDRAAGCILSLLHDEVLRKKLVEDALKNLDNISWTLAAKKIINAYSRFNLI